MKKIKSFVLFTILLTFLSLLFGCGLMPKTDLPKTVLPKTDLPKDDNKPIPTLSKIEDYYPTIQNSSYQYLGEGNEYASFKEYVDYNFENKTQRRINNGGTETIKVIQILNGELAVIFSASEIYHRENFLEKEEGKKDIILKEPLTVGTAWESMDGNKREITSVNKEIETPLGKYSTLEVKTTFKDSVIFDYYAKNVGLIKTEYKSGDFIVTSTLEKIISNSPLIQEVTFYYPDINNDKLVQKRESLSFNTNDITKLKFEEYLKNSPASNLGKLISKNTKIKSLYLNKDNMVYVDFSKELVSEMNAGSGYESMILQSITNTLGNYYGVKKVYITVEGQPYSSGHILMKKGEAFTVK